MQSRANYIGWHGVAIASTQENSCKAVWDVMLSTTKVSNTLINLNNLKEDSNAGSGFQKLGSERCLQLSHFLLQGKICPAPAPRVSIVKAECSQKTGSNNQNEYILHCHMKYEHIYENIWKLHWVSSPVEKVDEQRALCGIIRGLQTKAPIQCVHSSWGRIWYRLLLLDWAEFRSNASLQCWHPNSSLSSCLRSRSTSSYGSWRHKPSINFCLSIYIYYIYIRYSINTFKNRRARIVRSSSIQFSRARKWGSHKKNDPPALGSLQCLCSFNKTRLFVSAPETPWGCMRFKLLHMRQHFSTSQEFSWANPSLLCAGLVDKHLTKQNEVHSNTYHGHAICKHILNFQDQL